MKIKQINKTKNSNFLFINKNKYFALCSINQLNYEKISQIQALKYINRLKKMGNIAKLDILNKQIIGCNYIIIDKFLRMIASKNVTILMNSE